MSIENVVRIESGPLVAAADGVGWIPVRWVRAVYSTETMVYLGEGPTKARALELLRRQAERSGIVIPKEAWPKELA